MVMENQLSLNITSRRAEVLLDKLNGLSLPFTEKGNVVEMKESLMKIQEASTDVADSRLRGERARYCSKKLKEAVYKAEDVLDEYLTERLETQITQPLSITELRHSMTSSSSSSGPGSAYSRLTIITAKLGSKIREMEKALNQQMDSSVNILQKSKEKLGSPISDTGKELGLGMRESEEEQCEIIDAFPEEIELAEQVRGVEDETMEVEQIKKKVMQDFTSTGGEYFARPLGSAISDTGKELVLGMGSRVMKRAGKSEEEESQIIQQFLEKIELAEQVRGREVEKEEIVQLLINKNEPDLLFIPIVGEDGIGKTTLARLAFNDERVQTHFQLKLWIQAEDGSDPLTKTIRRVIEGVTGSNCDISDAGELQRRVHGALGGTLFLLVLDDVLDDVLGDVFGTILDLNRLINFLSCVGSGSRILITASYFRVESRKRKSNIKPYCLGPLSDDDCWSLFSQRAFYNPIQENDPKFVTIGRDIVNMCKGVPLFVKMFAGLLYFQREESEWEFVREGVMKNWEELAMSSAAAKADSGGISSGGSVDREHMFDKVLKPSDVGKLNCLVIPKQHAEKYFPLDSTANEKGLLLNFEDPNGKPWRFRYSYWNSSQSYVMTKGWSRFVKEKKLDAGDIVSFERGVCESGKDRLYIDWKHRQDAGVPSFFQRWVPWGRHFLYLRLCYSHLKPDLKQCFAFCSLFPKGYEIDKETLIQLWMANGMVPSRDGMESEDVGNEIFSEMVVRSFFQEIRQPFANVTTFKVHNLLHDLASRAMDGDCAYAEDNFASSYLRARHRSFPSPQLKFPSWAHEQVRTFIQLPLHMDLHHLCSAVGSFHPTITWFQVLRVLDLRGWNRNSLPMEIGSLKLLRYLDLSYTSVVNLPATVTTLVNLQTLKLCGCRLLRLLPEDTKNMINLRYLDIRGCNLLTHIPPKLGQLRCLQVLNFFIVGNKTSECSDMEELKCLKLRGSLQMRHLERVKDPADAQQANLLGKPNLGELHLCWRDYNEGEEKIDEDKATFGVNIETEVLEVLQPHQKLEKLLITDYMGIHFPGWLMGSQLQNLVEIRLYGCRRCEYLPPLGQLPSLKVLCMENLDAVEYIGNEFYGNDLSEGFPSLETLEIRYMPNLEAWLELRGKKAFLRLSKLGVAFCSKLTTMPCFPSIKDLFLKEIDSLLLSSVADCTSLASLTIHGILGLMSLPKGLLQNLTSLRSLTISSCENLVLLLAQLQNLTSLEHFSLSHCTGLVSLPEEGIQGLASLKELKIEHCKNLTDLSEGFQYLTTLRMLHVNWCDKLEYLPDGLQYLTNLRHLRLFYCHGLKTLPEGIGNLSSLEVLSFGSPKLTSLPDAIENLSSLQVLMIGSLSLTSLPKGLQQLTTLRELFIVRLPQLVSLPEWLENLKSLKSLYIMGCPNMTSLPAGLQRLTSLQRLSIHDCPNLNERCKVTGEDWHKIQHIPRFVIE